MTDNAIRLFADRYSVCDFLGEFADAALSYRRPVPGDPETGLVRRDSHAVLDAHAVRREIVQLRNIFDVTSIRHGAGEADMQLHQEMRAHRHVERFRRMRDLQPRRDPADPRDVGLHDRTAPSSHIFAEMAYRVDRLADRDRGRRSSG